MKCENKKCNKEHDGSYGSGRFCCRSCANTRIHSYETKKKIGVSLVNYNKDRERYEYICPDCNNIWYTTTKIKDGRLTRCKKCKRKVPHRKENVLSIKEVSKRTISKILRRSNYCCVLCGWDKSICDIHHIIPRRDGGSDDMNNLIGVCPNCHREIESENVYTKEFLFKLSLGIVFKDWKKYYLK
jgi:hypothetical protein